MLYNLQYETTFEEMVGSPKALGYNAETATGAPHEPLAVPSVPIIDSRSQPSPLTASLATPQTASADPQPHPFPPPPKEPQVYDIRLYDMFMQQNSEVKFVYVQWLDYVGNIQYKASMS